MARSAAGRSAAAAVVVLLVVLSGAAFLVHAPRTVGIATVVRSFSAADDRPGPEVAPAPNPFSMGMPASLVLGQPNFTSAFFGSGAVNLTDPESVLAPPSGWIWVVDSGNNRVLGYSPPFVTGMAATVALGQTSLTTHAASTTQAGLWEPGGIAVDKEGDLFVADSTNNRVLEYVPPFATGMDANLVLGQVSYTTNGRATTPSGLDHPVGLAFNAAGDLFVSDRGNNRVLEFVPPFTNGMPASVVLGQALFTTSATATTATNLSFPDGLVTDAAGDLFVADTGNQRVVEFAPPFANGMAASLVLGQKSFTTTGEALPNGMDEPYGVAFDSAGDLWVTDVGMPNRVSEFLPPLLTNENATIAIGQASLTGTRSGTTNTELQEPYGVAIDASGDLWVADLLNSRVLEFVPSDYAVGFAETGLPSGTVWSVTFDSSTVSTSGAWMTFYAVNGTYPFSVGSVGGYSETPTSGTVTVYGTNVSVAVTFTGTILGLSPPVFWPVLVVILLLIAIALAVLLLRERRKKRGPPAPLTPAPGATPPPGPPNPPG